MQYKEELEYEIDLKKRTADFDGEHSKKLWVRLLLASEEK